MLPSCILSSEITFSQWSPKSWSKHSERRLLTPASHRRRKSHRRCCQNGTPGGRLHPRPTRTWTPTSHQRRSPRTGLALSFIGRRGVCERWGLPAARCWGLESAQARAYLRSSFMCYSSVCILRASFSHFFTLQPSHLPT